MRILTAVIVGIGLLPWIAIELLKNVVMEFVPALTPDQFVPITGIFRTISASLVALIGLTGLLFGLRAFLLRKRKVSEFKTWDCGYQVGSSRLQYTSSSFAQPFLHLVAELVPQKIQVEKQPVLFPKEASLESHTQDISERFIFRPSIGILNKFLNLFSWIQSGRMQQYIMYGLVFLVALLIWILGIK